MIIYLQESYEGVVHRLAADRANSNTKHTFFTHTDMSTWPKHATAHFLRRQAAHDGKGQLVTSCSSTARYLVFRRKSIGLTQCSSAMLFRSNALPQEEHCVNPPTASRTESGHNCDAPSRQARLPLACLPGPYIYLHGAVKSERY